MSSRNFSEGNVWQAIIILGLIQATFIEGRLPLFDAQVQCEDPVGLQQQSFLWRISGTPPSYLFGTIHVPYTRVWEYIPPSTKAAFEQAEVVYFELDLSAPWTVTALDQCQQLAEGKTVDDVLPSLLVRRIEAQLNRLRQNLGTDGLGSRFNHAVSGGWRRKRPIWIMLLLNSLMEGRSRSRGVPILDLFLAQEAGRMGKSTGAVERVHEQCLPLNRLGLPQVMFALNSTLRYQERLENDGKNVPLDEEESNEFTEQLIRHYNCRDLDATLFSRDTAQVHLVSETEAERRKAEEIESYFWKELILNRNMRMGDRVVKIVRSNPDRSLFFAFGAGHFLGNYTVLDVIRTQGLEVTEVGPNEEIVPPTIPRPVKTSTGPVGPIHSPSDTRGSGSSFRGPVCYSYPCENQQRLLQEKLTAIRHPLLEFPRPTVRTFHDLWIREQSSDHSPRFGLQSSIPFGSLTAASTPTLYLGQNYFFLLLILFLLRVLFPSRCCPLS